MKFQYYIFIGVFLFLSFFQVKGQSIDALKQKLEKTYKNTDKFTVLLQIARTYTIQKNYENAIVYYVQASNILQKEDQKEALANTYDEIGMVYQSWEGYNKSIEYFQNAYRIKQEQKDKKGQINTCKHIAWSFFQLGNYKKSHEYYSKALKLYDESKNPEEDIADLYNKLSIVTELNGQYEKAIQYSKENLKIYQQLNDYDGSEKALNNIGFLYRKKKDYRKALQVFKEALILHEQHPNNQKAKKNYATTLINMGVIYTNLRDYEEALDYYKKSLIIRQQKGNKAMQADALNRIAANYSLGGNDEKAKPSVLKAIELGEQVNAQHQLLDSYKILADIYETEGNLEAYGEFNKKYTDLKNKIAQEKNQREKALLDRKFIIEQLESRLKLSQSENENQKLLLERQKLALDNAKKEQQLNRERAEQAEKDRELASARAEQAEKDRQLARIQAEQAEKDKELAKSRAEQAEKDKEIARIRATQAEKDKEIARIRATQAEKDKEKVEKKNEELLYRQQLLKQLYLFLSIIGFVVLVLLFVLFFFYKNRKKNKLLNQRNIEIQEINASLNQKKEEIEAQRDNLIDLNKQITKTNKEIELVNFELSLVNEEINQQKEEIEAQRDAIELERKKSDDLLLNILPFEIAKELKETNTATPKSYEMVTVLFTDFKGFTEIAAKLSPEEVIKELDYCFLKFDEIVEKHNLEKIKTIGDAYMCAGGIPVPNLTNPIDAVKAGLEIQEFMNELKKEKASRGEAFWEVRLGIHTGALVAGVVGRKKFAYDIWGDAVNTASRMESSGEVGKVNISGETYALVSQHFECTYRGKIHAKNKGEVDMYFVDSLKT